MTINIGFQMDPLESLSLEDDTTLAIIEECLSRNYNIWHFLPKDVSYINGEVMAFSKIIPFVPNLLSIEKSGFFDVFFATATINLSHNLEDLTIMSK